MADLTSPLLSEDVIVAEEDAGPASAASHVPSSSPPTTWWRKVFQKLARIVNNILDFCYWKIWRRISPSSSKDKLSLLQASRLEALQQRVLTHYDVNELEHVEYLQRLWKAAFPEDQFPADIKSAKWKTMGWQNENPVSDIRGGGLLALEMIVSFAETRPREFETIMTKKRGVRSEWEYPFAAAGINISFMLVEILGLRTPLTDDNGGTFAATPAQHGFLKLLQSDEFALETLFIETFVLLDRIWLDQGASYMEFPKVLAQVKGRVVETLGRRWLSTTEDLKALHD